MTQDDWIEAVAEVAEAWSDPDLPARAEAVEVTLEAPNRFTEEGLAFALNHRMHQLRPEMLRGWVGGRTAREVRNVGVLCADAPPLDGLAEVLAALLLGHRVVVSLSPASPALLSGFLTSLMDRSEDGVVRFIPRDTLFEQADVLVVSGDEDQLEAIIERADDVDISSDRRWLRRHGVVVAVIDGREDAETRSGLAEDLLLHEGLSPRTPSLLWAPADLTPDSLLDTLAGFRELYPPHPATDGTLSMATAFLASAKQAHATGPGFLVSKGEPEPQAAGHFRWVEYADLAEVTDWLRTHAVDFVVAAPGVAERLETTVPIVTPGDAHRPALADEQPGLIAFLADV